MATKKGEFLAEFKEVTGKDASDFKGKPKEFVAELNVDGRDWLRFYFREAVREIRGNKTVTEEDAAAGLSQLFDLA